MNGASLFRRGKKSPRVGTDAGVDEMQQIHDSHLWPRTSRVAKGVGVVTGVQVHGNPDLPKIREAMR